MKLINMDQEPGGLKFDSRIFKETTNKARITLCDIESLAEIYNYRSIRWKSKN